MNRKILKNSIFDFLYRTREPIQDRDFRWIGYHDDVLNSSDGVDCVAESDPLFPLHSKDQPLLKFLNPFYELWYESMPSALKQLKLMNSDKEIKESLTDKDDIRATRIVQKWDYEAQEFRYYIGPKDIDQSKLDQEILYNKQNDEKETEDQQQEEEEGQEQEDKFNPTLRSGYLSKDLYDKNSYDRSGYDEWLKSAPEKSADELGIEAMTYLRRKETLKELKDSFDEVKPRSLYSKKQMGEYYVKALKKEYIKPCHLNMKELELIISYLGLEQHTKQNPNTKRNTAWVPYTSPMKRKPPKTKWNDWNGNAPVEMYTFKPQQYTDINGVFNDLNIYYKMRHPGQPPWGVWDISEPNFDTEYYQMKVDGYLKSWRKTPNGRKFIEKHLKRKYQQNSQDDVVLYNKLLKGIDLLEKEKSDKLEKINDNKQFKWKLDGTEGFEQQCKEKTLEIQQLQRECQRIDEILDDVYVYNEL